MAEAPPKRPVEEKEAGEGEAKEVDAGAEPDTKRAKVEATEGEAAADGAAGGGDAEGAKKARGE